MPEIALTLILLVSAVFSPTASFGCSGSIRVQRDQVTLVSLPLPLSATRMASVRQVLPSAPRGNRTATGNSVRSSSFPTPSRGRTQTAPSTSKAVSRQAVPTGLSPHSARSRRTIFGRWTSRSSRDVFTDHDRDPAPAVAIVNATFARRYFAAQDPIGKRVRFGEPVEDWITIVGIAGDSRNQALTSRRRRSSIYPTIRFPLPLWGSSREAPLVPARGVDCPERGSHRSRCRSIGSCHSTVSWTSR